VRLIRLGPKMVGVGADELAAWIAITPHCDDPAPTKRRVRFAAPLRRRRAPRRRGGQGQLIGAKPPLVGAPVSTTCCTSSTRRFCGRRPGAEASDLVPDHDAGAVHRDEATALNYKRYKSLRASRGTGRLQSRLALRFMREYAVLFDSAPHRTNRIPNEPIQGSEIPAG